MVRQCVCGEVINYQSQQYNSTAAVASSFNISQWSLSSTGCLLSIDCWWCWIHYRFGGGASELLTVLVPSCTWLASTCPSTCHSVRAAGNEVLSFLWIHKCWVTLVSLVSTGPLSCGTATLSVGETYTSYSSSAVLCDVVDYHIWIDNVTRSQQQIIADESVLQAYTGYKSWIMQ